MAIDSILKEVDQEIARLQQVRKLLSASDGHFANREVTKHVPAAKKRSRRRLSPEARERIAAAQRKRWAAVKKSVKK